MWKKIIRENLDLDYNPSFYSSKDASRLFRELESEITYFTGDLAKVRVFGKWHDVPRQQCAFGDTGLTYKYSGLSVPALSWTPALASIRSDINKSLGKEFNFVLVNRYKDGNDYMGEHRDDESELDRDSGIASLSLGADRDFIFRHTDARSGRRKVPPVRLVLTSGSLLLMNYPTNVHWFHSLPKQKKVYNPRINLTFRKIVCETNPSHKNQKSKKL